MRQSAAACFVDRIRGAWRLRWSGRVPSSPSTRKHGPIECAHPEQSVPKGIGMPAPWNQTKILDGRSGSCRDLQCRDPWPSGVATQRRRGVPRRRPGAFADGRQGKRAEGRKGVHRPDFDHPALAARRLRWRETSPARAPLGKEVNGQERPEWLSWENIGIRGTVFVKDVQLCCFVVFTSNFPLVAYSGA